MKLSRFLLFMLRIRRVEFRVAEVPILAIPILLLVQDTSIFNTFSFWEGVFIFFLLFAFGDMINCLADRDLDAVYKPHLSEAVYGLGVGFVTLQIVASALLALGLSIHLSWVLDRWSMTALTIVGLALGYAYSVKPFQFKGRGPLQLVCLWTIIFFGPIVFVSQLITPQISVPLLIFAAFYGIAQMGVILVNTAEDYPEDLASGIHTTVVTLGLHRSMNLAFWMVVCGALGTSASLIWFYLPIISLATWALGLLPVIAAFGYVSHRLWTLRRLISDQNLETSIAVVKRVAKAVPLWITITALSTLWAAIVVFSSANAMR